MSPEAVRQIVREELEQLRQNDELLDAQQVADIFGLTKQTVWQMRREGVLPFVEVAAGRFMFKKSDVQRYIEQHTKQEQSAAQKARKAWERKRSGTQQHRRDLDYRP